MKFLNLVMFDAAKTADMAAVADKLASIPGTKVLAQYVCQGILFSGVPANAMVTLSIIEADSNEALAARNYPAALAGATVWNVPVLELPVAGVAEVEKKYRG